jgi:hypothetical protein
MDLAISRREALIRWQPSLLVLSAGYCGALAWQGGEQWLPFAFLLPLIWRLADNRATAGGVALAYYLMAARDLPAGSAVFFGEGVSLGIGLWLAVSLLLALPWFLLHGRTWMPLRALLALVLVAVPPLGIIGWAHPLTGVGLLFPGGGGWALGLGLFFLSISVRWPPFGFWMLLAGVLTPHPAIEAPAGWRGVETHWRMASGSRDLVAQLERQQALTEVVKRDDQSKVLIFPETILGRWAAPSSWIWADTARQAQARGQTLILGAEWTVDDAVFTRPEHFENIAGRLTAAGELEPLYRQLMPIPVAMWRPWVNETAVPAWFSPQIAQINGQSTAFLICYEQLLVWPVLVAMSQDPKVLVGLSNDWWARETRVPAIQRSVMEAWARLFGTKLVISQNR